MKKSILGVLPFASSLLTIAWCAPAMANNGMQTYEGAITWCSAAMPLPDGTTDCDNEPEYVACLGEFIVGENHIVGNYHEFYTPSFTAHLVDNWKVTSMFYGVTTGRMWYGTGGSPLSSNAGDVNTFEGMITWSTGGKLTYKPVAIENVSSGPMWIENFTVKFVQNANSEVVVDFIKSSFDDGVKCLGPKE